MNTFIFVSGAQQYEDWFYSSIIQTNYRKVLHDTVFLCHTDRAIMVGIVWYLDLQLTLQSVPITTKVTSLNPTHGEVYSIQHYVIKFVSDLQKDNGFLQVLWFPPSITLFVMI